MSREIYYVRLDHRGASRGEFTPDTDQHSLTFHVRSQNTTSTEHQSFSFLDHRWVLFGGIRSNPNPGADCFYHPYLEIIDPAVRTCSTILELDESVFKHASRDSKPYIRVCSGAGHERGPFTENESMPFVCDASRGIINVVIHWHTPDTGQVRYFESYVPILDIEGVLSMVPSDFKRRHAQWKDLSRSTAVFSYDYHHAAPNRVLWRDSYVAGFRYVSPTQPLDPTHPTGLRCSFVYDFNPYRETPDPLASAVLGDLDPDSTGNQKTPSKITREVIGGLSCWKTRFDLPAAALGVAACHVSLTDGGVVVFEVRPLAVFPERLVVIPAV